MLKTEGNTELQEFDNIFFVLPFFCSSAKKTLFEYSVILLKNENYDKLYIHDSSTMHSSERLDFVAFEYKPLQYLSIDFDLKDLKHVRNHTISQ